MKILVCISKSPDTTTKISFTPDNTQLDTNGVQFIINPNDEFALSRAIEIREASGGSITVVNVGEADTEPIIRKALAIGADDAIRINAEPTDAYFVASQIAAVASEGSYDLVMAGRETIDHNGSQVGGMMAELLDLPYVTGVLGLELHGNEATLVREVEGGKETLSASLPLVLGAIEGLAEFRIPNMRGIMSARTKPLTVKEPAVSEQMTQVEVFEQPPAKVDCRYIESDQPEKLVELLHQDAKVI